MSTTIKKRGRPRNVVPSAYQLMVDGLRFRISGKCPINDMLVCDYPDTTQALEVLLFGIKTHPHPLKDALEKKAVVLYKKLFGEEPPQKH